MSTDEQVRSGMGLDIQRDQITRWANGNGHTIAVWCSDEGVSGSIVDRPGLLEVYEALSAAEGVVAQTDTRFGRTLEAQEAFFGKVWGLDRHVFTVDVGEIHEDDPNDPMRTAMRRMRGIMAELEAGLIRKRMADGRAAAKAAGKFPGGPRSFGWTLLDGYLVPVEREQITLRLIKSMREQGKSMRGIVNYLNDHGITTTEGGRWSVTQVKRMLPPGIPPSERKAHLGWLYEIKSPPQPEESIL